MGKYRAITLMTAVQITQPPLKSFAAEQSQKQKKPKPTYGFRETSGSCPCGEPTRGWARSLKGYRSVDSACAGGDHFRTNPFWHKPILRSLSPQRSYHLPSLCPAFNLTLPQTRVVQEILNRAYRGRNNSCQFLVFLWLGKPPPFCKSKYFLGL